MAGIVSSELDFSTIQCVTFFTKPEVKNQIHSYLSQLRISRSEVTSQEDFLCRIQDSPVDLVFVDEPACQVLFQNKDFFVSGNLKGEILIFYTEKSSQVLQYKNSILHPFFLLLPIRESQFLSLLHLLLSRINLRRQLNAHLLDSGEIETFGTLIGKSPEMKEVFHLADYLTGRNESFLIFAPPGSGKESLARTIHEFSSQKFFPFHQIDCRMPVFHEELEHNLFRKQSSPVSLNSTYYLKHIDALPLSMQIQLIEFLQHQNSNLKVRIIASTEKSLSELLVSSCFDEKLYYALTKYALHIPPLYRRAEDIPILVKQFLKRFARENRSPELAITNRALQKLMSYQWKQNVQELEKVLELACFVAGEGTIDEVHLPQELIGGVDTLYVGSDQDHFPPWEEIERRYILKVLKATGGNKLQAADLLGINRATLHRKIKLYEKENKMESC